MSDTPNITTPRERTVGIIENAYWRGYYQATGEVTDAPIGMVKAEYTDRIIEAFREVLTSPDTVERAAKALYEAMHRGGNWDTVQAEGDERYDGYGASLMSHFRDAARATLTAAFQSAIDTAQEPRRLVTEIGEHAADWDNYVRNRKAGKEPRQEEER